MGRMRGVVERPEGLRYHEEVLDPAEEQRLVGQFERMDFHEVSMRGQVARRTVRHFGFEYGYESWQLVPGDPLPAELVPLRDRCAALAGLDPSALAQTLVTRYPAGSSIGWHRDAPVFGPVVVGVSLLSSCLLRFQRATGKDRQVFEQPLAARSGYVLAGAARSSWQHSIPPVADLRYSVTFRTLRADRRQ